MSEENYLPLSRGIDIYVVPNVKRSVRALSGIFAAGVGVGAGEVVNYFKDFSFSERAAVDGLCIVVAGALISGVFKAVGKIRK